MTYLHPKMANYLSDSYGILVYQEDILFTALELAGYDWGSVDTLRQAIGKKKPKEMAQQHDIFVEGCIKHSSMTRAEAEKLWELFVPFQGYGFNKAHAASYGIVSYQTAYLKAHYPVEYMTALMTAESGNTEKIVEAVDECRRIGIQVLPPDINQSHTNFTVESNPGSLDQRAIRFGLQAIKNVGEAAISAILSARSLGKFISLTDFCLRVDSQKVNRKVLESLVKSGSFDAFGSRAALLAVIDRIRESGSSINKLKSLGQFSLFGESRDSDLADRLPEITDFDKNLKLAQEKELLGFYLTEHPHAEKIQEINRLVSLSISRLTEENYSGRQITTGGVIETCRNVFTKSANLPMCFAKVSDLKKSIELVVFPKVYASFPDIWKPDNLIVFSGKVESRPAGETLEDETEAENIITVVAESVVPYTGPDSILPQNARLSKAVSIYIPKNTPQSSLVELNTLLQKHKGTVPVNLVFAHNGSSRTIPLPYGLNWQPDLDREIAGLLKS